MKVLHFSNKPAYPRIDGGSIAISQLLNGLINDDSLHVKHLTIATPKHSFNLKAYPSSIQNAVLDSIFINTKIRPIQAFIALCKNESYNVSRFINSVSITRFNEMLSKNHFDIAILESIFLLPYLPLLKERKIKVFVRTHNIEHTIVDKRYQLTNNIFKSYYLKILASQLKKYEIEQLKKVDGIIAISDKDAEFFSSLINQNQVISLPTSFKVKDEIPNYKLNDFYFIGAMDWYPNFEAVQWLINCVLPHLSKHYQVHLAGKNMEQKIAHDSNIFKHGEVANSNAYIEAHGICLIPIHSGGGIKIKLLESMAQGKPIITTSEGASGIDVIHQEHVLIADNANDFAKAMELLAKDETLRIKLGTNAKSFIASHFGESIISKKLSEFIRND